MSWDDLEVNEDKAREAQSAIRERQVELANGQKVLEDMTKRFLLENDTSLAAQNINYEAAYHNGEAGVMRYIVHQIQQAEKL
jgi:hypothetical protein